MHQKDKNGITLIALIITIIVMLILVGVVISIAIQAGLFSTAKMASEKTQIEIDKEKLLLAVVGAIDHNSGKVNFSTLVTELRDDWEYSGSDFPCVFTNKSSKNKFTVEEDGTITIGTSTGTTTPTNYAKENELRLGTGVSLVEYSNLTGDTKQAVDHGKVIAVLTENIDGTATIAVIPTEFSVSSTEGENTISGGLVVRDGSNNEFVWIPVPTLSNMAVLQEGSTTDYRGVLYNWITD